MSCSPVGRKTESHSSAAAERKAGRSSMAKRMGCSPVGRKTGDYSSVVAEKRTGYSAIALRTD